MITNIQTIFSASWLFLCSSHWTPVGGMCASSVFFFLSQRAWKNCWCWPVSSAETLYVICKENLTCELDFYSCIKGRYMQQPCHNMLGFFLKHTASVLACYLFVTMPHTGNFFKVRKIHYWSGEKKNISKEWAAQFPHTLTLKAVCFHKSSRTWLQRCELTLALS